jgi:hypothetical protein
LPEDKAVVDDFVERYFKDSMYSGESWRILWFTKPPRSQSIPDLEHIHILIKGADEELINKWISDRNCPNAL